MTRPIARACAVAFLVMIFLPGTLGLIGVRGAAIENRRLTEFPSVGPSSVVDQAFYTSLSQFLNDRLPLRGAAVKGNGLMAVHVWKDSPNPDVHIGVGDWLYATPFRSNCPDRMPLEVVDSLAALGRAYAAAGREMRLLLAPNKAVIYPENLGAFAPSHFACGTERLRMLRTRLAQVPEIGLIDMAPPLSDLKSTSAEPVYFPGDSHWTLRGAAAMSRAVVNSIAPGLWRDADVKEVRTISLPMDLALLIGVPRQVPATVTETHRDGIATTAVERIDCERGPSCVIRYVSSGDPGRLIRQRTLFVRDSFGTMGIETLAPYFADITFLFWSDDIHEQLTKRVVDADVVVYETLDQYLFARVQEGFTTLAIPPRPR